MCKKAISKEVRRFLTDHIDYMQREKERLIKEHYSEETEECKNFDSFFMEYISNMNRYVENAKIAPSGADGCPLVIIGSIVEVHDMDENEICKYKVVPPFFKASSSDFDFDCASCMSPMGKALLMRGIDETVNVEVPAGTLHYLIKNIILPDFPVQSTAGIESQTVPLRQASAGII